MPNTNEQRKRQGDRRASFGQIPRCADLASTGRTSVSAAAGVGQPLLVRFRDQRATLRAHRGQPPETPRGILDLEPGDTVVISCGGITVIDRDQRLVDRSMIGTATLLPPIFAPAETGSGRPQQLRLPLAAHR